MSLFDPYQINRRRVKKSHKGQIIQQRPSKNYFAISPDELPRSIQVFRSYFPQIFHVEHSYYANFELNQELDVFLTLRDIWDVVRHQFNEYFKIPQSHIQNFTLQITMPYLRFEVYQMPTTGTQNARLYRDNVLNINNQLTLTSSGSAYFQFYPNTTTQWIKYRSGVLSNPYYINTGNPLYLNECTYTNYQLVKNNQIPDDYKFLELDSDDLQTEFEFRNIFCPLITTISYDVK